MSLIAPMMIPEIWELIFLHLDQTTLTSCLGVCRMWNKLITSSQKVLQRRYLRPYVPTAAELSPRPDRCRWLNDPFNPAIPPAFDYPSTELTWKHWQSTIAYGAFPMLPWTRNPAAWQRKEASWRRIEVSQPPIRKLVVEQVDKGRAEIWEEATLLFPAGDQGTGPGLLMGELYNHIEKRLQHPD
ncbi:hypothetical protein BS50DRAFT_676884 [Corynespora cassiicola Philippines]|uniref:F-box domain-containing protein n=1 Tax=Corynespora cassiicola Philippines TaxID=1448308 RepID=A0A2T2NPX3_CORCC|nr:hypothetical protein BS50DRAFT_676884 [Corynespora cassiicola Philippines]